ncbi:DUF4272 domain-containing protein [Paenibacillus sp. UNC499MF]|uniref:DUF4272 domain-containing protein n=1 Tax=Paenibacillus sp. UNC499MF TaxID=1502751 RepID=UPI0008A024F4|nr:DUF4272 domain-containing protein [Paenibacillus sp. UNC499MF]SEG79795.1 protein of unknown function [Paenibacillus sp. UNC499MF]
MNQCTLYISIKGYEKITEAIRTAFGDKQVQTSPDGRQITVVDKKLFGKTTVTFSLMTLESNPDEFQPMIRGMYGFFSQIETPHEHIQDKVLRQITGLNAAVGIVSSKEIDTDTMNRILDAASRVHAVLFLPTGQLLNPEGKVILSAQGESEVEDFTVTVSTDLIDAHIQSSPSAEARKERNMLLLREQGVPVIEHLPVIDGDEFAVIRTKEEIAARAAALCMIAMYGADVAEGSDIKEARDYIEDVIELYGVSPFFTEKERAFLESGAPDPTDAIQFAWMYECYWVLLWSLGYVEELGYPGSVCDVQAAVDALRLAGDFDTFYERANVRPKEDILDEADRIYRYDWACVDARINGRPAPAGLDGGVVVERHRALNWLVRYMDAEWDDVSMDT